MRLAVTGPFAERRPRRGLLPLQGRRGRAAAQPPGRRPGRVRRRRHDRRRGLVRLGPVHPVRRDVPGLRADRCAASACTGSTSATPATSASQRARGRQQGRRRGRRGLPARARRRRPARPGSAGPAYVRAAERGDVRRSTTLEPAQPRRPGTHDRLPLDGRRVKDWPAYTAQAAEFHRRNAPLGQRAAPATTCRQIDPDFVLGPATAPPSGPAAASN